MMDLRDRIGEDRRATGGGRADPSRDEAHSSRKYPAGSQATFAGPRLRLGAVVPRWRTGRHRTRVCHHRLKRDRALGVSCDTSMISENGRLRRRWRSRGRSFAPIQSTREFDAAPLACPSSPFATACCLDRPLSPHHAICDCGQGRAAEVLDWALGQAARAPCGRGRHGARVRRFRPQAEASSMSTALPAGRASVNRSIPRRSMEPIAWVTMCSRSSTRSH